MQQAFDRHLMDDLFYSTSSRSRYLADRFESILDYDGYFDDFEELNEFDLFTWSSEFDDEDLDYIERQGTTMQASYIAIEHANRERRKRKENRRIVAQEAKNCWGNKCEGLPTGYKGKVDVVLPTKDGKQALVEVDRDPKNNKEHLEEHLKALQDAVNACYSGPASKRNTCLAKIDTIINTTRSIGVVTESEPDSQLHPSEARVREATVVDYERKGKKVKPRKKDVIKESDRKTLEDTLNEDIYAREYPKQPSTRGQRSVQEQRSPRTRLSRSLSNRSLQRAQLAPVARSGQTRSAQRTQTRSQQARLAQARLLQPQALQRQRSVQRRLQQARSLQAHPLQQVQHSQAARPVQRIQRTQATRPIQMRTMQSRPLQQVQRSQAARPVQRMQRIQAARPIQIRSRSATPQSAQRARRTQHNRFDAFAEFF